MKINFRQVMAGLFRESKSHPIEDWTAWNMAHRKTKKKKSEKPASVGSVRGSQQANALNNLSGLTRGNNKPKESDTTRTKTRIREAATVREARPSPAEQTDGVKEGHICDVILITEGLGNRRNMNYYGPESISSSPLVFEGKPCFLDHPSESEERDIPERRIRQKCGYFKNCRVETIDGVRACLGELHFDLSEDGEQAYKKACTALHYKEEFPLSESEYVGLSINADGDVEDRTVEWQGETLQVNYVTRFRDAMSCDLVTSPARGGRFLALVESAAGAIPNKEVRPMNKGTEKTLKAAQTALDEAAKETDLAKAKEKTAEANKLFKAFLKEAAKAAYQGESEDEDESETESKGDMSGEDETESESGDGDSHIVTTHKVVKKTGKAAVPEAEDEADDAGDKKKDDDDDAIESNRIAIASMTREAGLDLPKAKLEKLAHGTIREAKEEIGQLKWMQESIVKKVIKQIRVPVATIEKVTESNRDGDGNEEGSSFLESCIR